MNEQESYIAAQDMKQDTFVCVIYDREGKQGYLNPWQSPRRIFGHRATGADWIGDYPVDYEEVEQTPVGHLKVAVSAGQVVTPEMIDRYYGKLADEN